MFLTTIYSYLDIKSDLKQLMSSKQQHEGLEKLLSDSQIQDETLEDIIRLIYGRRLKYKLKR